MHLARNDAVVPAHGASAFSDPTHACAGISVGRNGVCVYEHSGNYFAPLLAHSAPLTNWTHVAVVYQDGTPSLYLNGELAHRGLKSRFTVHSGFSVDPSGGGSFKGELERPAGFRPTAHGSRSCRSGEGEAARGFRVVSPGNRPGSGHRGSLGSRGFQLRVLRTEVRQTDKRAPSMWTPFPPRWTIGGPWEVRFPANMDVPERLTLDSLMSLTEQPSEAIKYFSGTAAYERAFDLPADRMAEGKRLLLDLGRVEAMAEVLLNGKNLGVLWKPPFIIDITERGQTGNEPPGSARDRHLA